MKLNIKNLAKKYNLSLLVLFGSMATSKNHVGSDVGFAYKRARELSMKDELQLRHDLMRIFHKEVDLVFIPKASPLLLKEIALKGRLICGKKKDFDELKVYGMKCFIDFEPYFRLREQILTKSF